MRSLAADLWLLRSGFGSNKRLRLIKLHHRDNLKETQNEGGEQVITEQAMACCSVCRPDQMLRSNSESSILHRVLERGIEHCLEAGSEQEERFSETEHGRNLLGAVFESCD